MLDWVDGPTFRVWNDFCWFLDSLMWVLVWAVIPPCWSLWLCLSLFYCKFYLWFSDVRGRDFYYAFVRINWLLWVSTGFTLALSLLAEDFPSFCREEYFPSLSLASISLSIFVSFKYWFWEVFPLRSSWLSCFTWRRSSGRSGLWRTPKFYDDSCSTVLNWPPLGSFDAMSSILVGLRAYLLNWLGFPAACLGSWSSFVIPLRLELFY